MTPLRQVQTDMHTPIAFIGYSGAGKTTLLEALVRRWCARGERVGVVKHTHHETDMVSGQGDAERYLAAGASAVALADDRGVIVMKSDGARDRRSYSKPEDLIAMLDADRIVIEGFKRIEVWPRIAVDRPGSDQIGTDNVVAVVGSETPVVKVPQFHRDDIEGIAAFVDRVTRLDEP